MRAAILLAAGRSRRFGRADKRLAMLHGKPLILHAIANALAAMPSRLVVVLETHGGRVARLLRAVREPRLRIVRAARHRDGVGASLLAGLAALRPIEREALIFLADMPRARAPCRMRLAGRDVVRPMVDAQPGHPALIRAASARARVTATDRGLIGRIDAARTGRVRGNAGNLLDLDTPAALRRLRLARA